MDFNALQFKHSWRQYQKRVLEAIDQHLNDDRLHIVAAPGAGKTTLGLEVFRRLKRRTLVLSPTRIIRDQWIERLADFTQQNVSELDWVSRDLKKPNVLTSTTYQAVHALACEQAPDSVSEEINIKEGGPSTIDEELDTEEALEIGKLNDENIDSFVKLLQLNNISALILDEAHHLKSEWWRVLDKTADQIPELIIVSLTATPPYDSVDHEWNKYETLCGPIDEEISVPELVKAGTLCHHQDFVWVVDVGSSEKEKIQDFEKRVSNFCKSLDSSPEFSKAILEHPWVSDTPNDLDIVKNPEVAIAILSYLKHKNYDIPPALLSLLDLDHRDIPDLGRRWWQILVEALLFFPSFKNSEPTENYITSLKKEMRAIELLKRREVCLEHSRQINRSLSQSIAKTRACCDIHAIELEKRGEQLRQVILTDYIRDEALESKTRITDVTLGAWPIFSELIKFSKIPESVALLTGRISVIHSSLLPELEIELTNNIFQVKPMEKYTDFVIVSTALNALTSSFTQLLLKGSIKVLVGTKSLLGEGWDAPAVNSLILASSVGSFMLTNQMRGRAIRKDKNVPDKISSIWHLAAIDHKSENFGWSDFNDLKRRFDTFVGLDEKKTTIESGIDRLHLKNLTTQPPKALEYSPAPANNKDMTQRYQNLINCAELWNNALTLDDAARVLPSVETPKIQTLKKLHFKNSFHFILIQLSAILAAAVQFLGNFIRLSKNSWVSYFAFFVIFIAVISLPNSIKAIKIF